MPVEIEMLYEILFQDEEGNIYTTKSDYDHSHMCDINPHSLKQFTKEDAERFVKRLIALYESD